MGGSGRIGKRGNPDQNILYEQNIFFNKIKGMEITSADWILM